MKKEYRVKKNKEFQEAFKKGKSFANRQFIVYSLKKPGQEHFRIGLSVSKKIGNAVMRNQIKRYIRQAFHELDNEIHSQFDYIIIARKPVADMGLEDIKKSLIHVLKLSRVLKKQKSGNNVQQNFRPNKITDEL
ncbi:ribonuclease P protein component [Cytobacillus praedii]|uniref:Ribonuclease P protein component n=1 Tax=Cytobacillus praedii TaxID=1742358 RepID=A0A4R1AQE7_9BACI|nr:ribonuclease P protein component [Cytobacillus praedii]MED3551831.1 ribonuclease P protein component [Cytobacillus praedii]MED3570939.1 ribonuclease P protein component [Cytobacillus praedii]TCJ02160.1 ribonuclease P protein component [Cytobacillus praedii]